MGRYWTLNHRTCNCGQYYKEKVSEAMREVESNQVGVGKGNQESHTYLKTFPLRKDVKDQE